MILDFIYPPRCFVCSKVLSNCRNQQLCYQCWKKITFFPRLCLRCRKQKASCCCTLSSIQDLRYVAKYHSTLQKMLVDFKFYGKVHYGSVLATMLFRSIERIPFQENIDCIIPVPMTTTRKILRGYNQAEILAIALARKMDVYCMLGNLRKMKYTRRQSSLKKQQRHQNLRNAFFITHENSLRNKNVLLVDDILTTGSTLRECARALQHSKCKNIYAGVIASV